MATIFQKHWPKSSKHPLHCLLVPGKIIKVSIASLTAATGSLYLYTLHAESYLWVVQGGVIWMLQTIATFLGMGHSLKRLAYAQTLEEQQAVWNGNWFVHFCKQGNAWLVDIFVRILAVIFLNRFVLW